MNAELIETLPSWVWERLMALRDRRVGTTDDERRAEEILPVKLTDEELLQMGKDNAQTCTNIASMERELEAAKKKVKADIEGLEALMQENNNCINTGRQDRTVDVVALLDYPRRGQKSTFRLDTFEIVRTSTMNHDETQRVMKLEEARESGKASGLPVRPPRKDKGKDKAPVDAKAAKLPPSWNGYAIEVKDGALIAGEKIPADEAERCAHEFGYANAAEMITALAPVAAVAEPPLEVTTVPAVAETPVPAPEAAPDEESSIVLPAIGGEPPAAQ